MRSEGKVENFTYQMDFFFVKISNKIKKNPI